MNEKCCSGCGISKPLTEYYKSKRTKSGVRSKCKLCDKKASQEYRKANPELKTKDRARNKRWREENPDKEKAKSRRWYEANKKKVKEYCQANKDKRNERTNKRRKEEPAYRLRENVSRAINHALKRQKGSKKGQSTFEALHYTVEQLKEHLEAQFDENMSWDNYGSYWEVDHIYPQSKLPYDSMKHPNFNKVWSLTNLQPLEKIANIKKGNKIII